MSGFWSGFGFGFGSGSELYFGSEEILFLKVGSARLIFTSTIYQFASAESAIALPATIEVQLLDYCVFDWYTVPDMYIVHKYKCAYRSKNLSRQ